MRVRVALPNNAGVLVQLAEDGRADAPAQVISEQRAQTNGAQGPFAFTLPYNPAQIVNNGTYVVGGNITVGGQLRFTTTTQYRVITGGYPTTVTIVMEPVALPRSASR